METVEFERFWAIYPRRQQKIPALKAWDKIKVSEELFASIKKNIHGRLESQEWSLIEKIYIPLPATYLNKEMWDDEVIHKRQGIPRYAPDSTRGHDLADDLRDHSWAK